MQKIANFIGGEFVAPLAGRYLDNINPATGKVYSLVPDSDVKDLEAAIQAAQKAFSSWSALSPQERSSYLRKMGQTILQNLDKLALAESIDNGKPLSLAAQLDIPRSAANFDFFADAITQFHGQSFRTNAEVMNYTEYSPLGVVGCISPWNLPLYLFTWKIAPALAAGNTVVAKPSEVTPMTAFLLGEIANQCGLPKGVLNIIHGTGPGVASHLVADSRIKAISFTGSTATGRHIANATANSFKKISLEMGGKNPNIIFADANFEKALETTLRSSFANQGQICLCGSRIFIERSVYSKFKDALVKKVQALKVGNPIDSSTDVGALVSKPQFEKVVSFIQKAKQEGGTILCGGNTVQLTGENSAGYFLQPTLIEGLPFTSEVNQEEIFGPVATLIPFDQEEEAIAMANSTRYGLAASVWTQDLSKAHRVAKKIESGIVWINCWMVRDLRTPFGGVKESGVGREGGEYALRFFSEIKNICIME